MDLEKLAQLLGLDKSTPADKVYATLAARVAAGDEAAKTVLQLGTELPKHGLKLDGCKVLRTEPISVDALDLSVKEGDDAEKQELKKRLQATQLSQVKSRLDGAKAEAKKLVELGIIPPAHQTQLEELLSIGEEVHGLALSTDGKEVVRKTVRAGEIVSKILGGLPSILKSGLSRLGADTVEKPGENEDDKKAQELSAKGSEIARKALGKKPAKETAGAK